jgi:hypothetical protein
VNPLSALGEIFVILSIINFEVKTIGLSITRKRKEKKRKTERKRT